jgi:hypothetical protein
MTLQTELNELKHRNIELEEKNKALEFKLRDPLAVKFSTGGKPTEEYLEMKNMSLQNEVDFWKKKCELLSTKYIQVLKKLKQDNDLLKQELTFDCQKVKEEFLETAKKLKRQYKKV